jgi:hypothetical protein
VSERGRMELYVADWSLTLRRVVFEETEDVSL